MTLKQFKRYTGPGGGTRRLHHNYTWAVGLVQVRTRKRIDLSVVMMGLNKDRLTWRD